VAPATANILAKAAGGLADDLLSTVLMSFDGPVIMAPAMNNRMWQQPAVQRNVAQLRADGVVLIGPEEGYLSCGTRGVGRMAEPETIFRVIAEQLKAVDSRQ
jgi:phosphopantothenoylcysteine decarboxylase/phosphopantothenate--cysteine ligase